LNSGRVIGIAEPRPLQHDEETENEDWNREVEVRRGRRGRKAQQKQRYADQSDECARDP
jgi:hypothetical protein